MICKKNCTSKKRGTNTADRFIDENGAIFTEVLDALIQL